MKLLVGLGSEFASEFIVADFGYFFAARLEKVVVVTESFIIINAEFTHPKTINYRIIFKRWRSCCSTQLSRAVKGGSHSMSSLCSRLTHPWIGTCFDPAPCTCS